MKLVHKTNHIKYRIRETNEELKGKTTDVQNWKKMSYDIFMVGKINLNSLVKTELRYSNF